MTVEPIESNASPGRFSAIRTPENGDRVQAAFKENCGLIVREQEEDLGIPRTIASELWMEDLGMKRNTIWYCNRARCTYP